MSQSQQIRKACASSITSSKTSKLLSFRLYRCISRYADFRFTLLFSGKKVTADMKYLDQAYLDDTGWYGQCRLAAANVI